MQFPFHYKISNRKTSLKDLLKQVLQKLEEAMKDLMLLREGIFPNL